MKSLFFFSWWDAVLSGTALTVAPLSCTLYLLCGSISMSFSFLPASFIFRLAPLLLLSSAPSVFVPIIVLLLIYVYFSQ